MPPTPAADDAWPEFLELWSRLRSDCELPGTVLVVEGERDRASLAALGLRAPIVLIHGGRSLSELAEEIGRRGRRAIVLTDWDLAGGRLVHRLRGFLEATDVRLDLEYRRRLSRVLRGEIAHVEGLAGWARRVAERHGAPLAHWLDVELGATEGVGPTG